MISDHTAAPIRRRFHAQMCRATPVGRTGRPVTTDDDDARRGSSGVFTPPRHHCRRGTVRERRRRNLRPRAGGKSVVRALVRDDAPKCREARSTGSVSLSEACGGRLGTGAVAAARSVAGVPRSCQGSHVVSHRDAHTSTVSPSKCPQDRHLRHRLTRHYGRWRRLS